jgi:hypothetical protein
MKSPIQKKTGTFMKTFSLFITTFLCGFVGVGGLVVAMHFGYSVFVAMWLGSSLSAIAMIMIYGERQ